MRVAGESCPSNLLSEVHDMLEVQPALKVSPGVRPRRGVSLEVQLISHAATVALAPEEVMLAHLENVADGRKGTDVASYTGRAPVAIGDHDGRVPANEVRDPALQCEIAWVLGFHVRRDGVAHGRRDRSRNVDTPSHGLVTELVQKEPSPRRTVGAKDGIEGLYPLVRLLGVESRHHPPQGRHVGGVVAAVLVHEGQGGSELRHLSTKSLGEVTV
mmetsp:Transcript_23243/g.55208  ORF Transcript_23243/g.55208 Transcript_23243/m.55208 type:complete len:215 (+) Transcript_23243:488-1132(+)